MMIPCYHCKGMIPVVEMERIPGQMLDGRTKAVQCPICLAIYQVTQICTHGPQIDRDRLAAIRESQSGGVERAKPKSSGVHAERYVQP